MAQNQIRTEARSWLSLFFSHLGWVAIALAFVSVLMTGISVSSYLKGSEFDRKGVLIEAKVQRVRTNPRVSSASRVVNFTYSVPEVRFSGSVAVGDWFLERHPVGTTTDIFYLPSEPARIAISARVDEAGGILSQAIAAIAGVLALGVTLFAGRRANEAVRARRYGTMIKAEVTRHEEIVGRNGRSSYLWRIHFLDADGQFGSSNDYQKDFVLRWPVGTQIDVYRGEHRNWWTEDIGPRDDINRKIPMVPARPPE